MSVLVTGGAGFIGSHLVDLLVERGYRVVVMDNLTTGRVENVNDSAVFYRRDITEREAVGEVLERERVRAIVHQAAQANVRKSIEEPLFDAGVNIMGSINLLEEGRRRGVEDFIFASSGGAIYGEPESLPVEESHPIAPLSQYGAAKYSVEKYMDVYRSLYGMRTLALRYSNVFGPRQDPYGEAGVIAIFASRISRGESPLIFGDGEQTRDFVYVGDVARANLLALEGGISGAFNIGTSKKTSVNEVASILLEEMGSDIEPENVDAIPGEVRDICLDISRSEGELGWKPRVGLREGIRRFLEWSG